MAASRWRACVLCGVLAILALAMPGAALARAPMKAVATLSILADFTRNVGGARVDVTALVGPNGDVHVFNPSPADARRLASADVIVVNGLGLEGWMTRLAQASGTKARIVVASAGVTPRTGEEHSGHGDAHGDHGDHDAADPHAWQSVAAAQIYVANIRDGLIAADPDGRALYEENARAYLAQLARLDADIRAAIAAIPPSRRRLVTNHAAFGYFADAYGLAFIAPEGLSPERATSARDVARIISQIRREAIPAVFLENVSDPRLLRQIAKESGARIGEPLYADALSAADGPAPTYLRMMRHNLSALSQALAD